MTQEKTQNKKEDYNPIITLSYSNKKGLIIERVLFFKIPSFSFYPKKSNTLMTERRFN